MQHVRLRQEVVDHLRKNKNEYKLFIDGNLTINEYINLIRRDGVWGGHLEMCILAKLHKFNIIVH